MKRIFHVEAVWDLEAAVWISETDIPGLVIEADRFAEFRNLVDTLGPEMLAENLGVHHAEIRVRAGPNPWSGKV